jgi:hypothetical protein
MFVKIAQYVDKHIIGYLSVFLFGLFILTLLSFCCERRKEKKQKRFVCASNMQTRWNSKANLFINEVNDVIHSDESSSKKVRKIDDLLRDLNKNDFLKIKSAQITKWNN